MNVVVEEDSFGPVHCGVQLSIRVEILAVQVYPTGVSSMERAEEM